MTPTAEQTDILAAVRETNANLIIQARAGGAKTTTLCMIAGALRGSVLCIAFNKEIQLELQRRIPTGAQAKTMNAIGYKALWRFYNTKFKVNTSKIFNICKELAEELTDPEERSDMRENLKEYMDLIRKAMAVGYSPDLPGVRPLVTLDEFLAGIEEIPSDLQLEVLNTALRRSFKLMQDGLIDFNDQIFWPAIMPSISFDTADNLLVDEAQDLSPLNHEILRRMGRRSRIIAVGDPAQAIYGFRGADQNSMDNLKQMFKMREMGLTICFRSAEDIVKTARFRAPEMQWRPGAPKGLVQTVTQWRISELQPGDAVICRNNAPLFSLALKMLKAGLYAELSSGDIVKGLVSKMKKLGNLKEPASEILPKVELWALEARKKNKNSKTVDDQRECMELFLAEAQTLGEAITLAEQIMQQQGRIKLMTGHKSKGLEFDRVWFLDPFLLSKEGQDPNIRYVIITRAREELRLIESKNLQEEV